MRPEPADVLLIDGRPGRFVWRGRLYTVLAVTERPPSVSAEAGDVGAAPARLCWQVLAAPGKNVPAAAFRLCLDTASGSWLLTRGAD